MKNKHYLMVSDEFFKQLKPGVVCTLSDGTKLDYFDFKLMEIGDNQSWDDAIWEAIRKEDPVNCCSRFECKVCRKCKDCCPHFKNLCARRASLNFFFDRNDGIADPYVKEAVYTPAPGTSDRYPNEEELAALKTPIDDMFVWHLRRNMTDDEFTTLLDKRIREKIAKESSPDGMEKRKKEFCKGNPDKNEYAKLLYLLSALEYHIKKYKCAEYLVTVSERRSIDKMAKTFVDVFLEMGNDIIVEGEGARI